jgi:hypothetical protein
VPDDQRPGPSLIRALGLLTGDLWSAITGRPRKPSRKTVLRHDVREETRDTPEAKVVLRRTTIEEIEVRKEPPQAT